jgi:hypothetical protein
VSSSQSISESIVKEQLAHIDMASNPVELMGAYESLPGPEQDKVRDKVIKLLGQFAQEKVNA